MQIEQASVSGTLESSDVQITLRPNPGGGLRIMLESVVMASFGDSILQTVRQVCGELGVADAAVEINDKGAFDHVIRARMQAAILRAAGEAKIHWETM